MKPRSNQEIADRLAEIRREKGLSQEELAEKLGLSRQAISKWERAESQPDMGNLIALADVYDMSIDEIVFQDTGTGASSAIDANEAQGEETSVVDVSDVVETGASEPAEFVAHAERAECAEPAEEMTDFPPPHGDPIDPSGHASSPYEFGSDPYGDPNAPQYVEATPVAPAKRRANPLLTFPYPVAVVVVYLFLGFAFGLWHPGWVLFFTIPFYYWAAAVVSRDSNYVEYRSGFDGPQ